MDLDKLTRGDQIIGVSGIVLFIVSFFSWLGISVSGLARAGLGGSASKSAWSFPLTLLAVLIGLAMLAYVVLKLADVKLPQLGSVTWSQVLLALAGIAFLFVLIKIITGPSGWDGFSIPSQVSKDRKIGIFLGLIATAGLVAGAFLNFQEEQKGAGSGPTS